MTQACWVFTLLLLSAISPQGCRQAGGSPWHGFRKPCHDAQVRVDNGQGNEVDVTVASRKTHMWIRRVFSVCDPDQGHGEMGK